ncbi:MAG: hypothetical protein ACR2KL_00285 [Nocardioidaceae bacterium]
MTYSLGVVQPRAARFFADDDDKAYERERPTGVETWPSPAMTAPGRGGSLLMRLFGGAVRRPTGGVL